MGNPAWRLGDGEILVVGKQKPLWKDMVDRDYIKDVFRTAFKRMAKGNVEEEIGKATNDLARYLTAELILNTREVMAGIREEVVGALDGAGGFLEEFAKGIDVEIIKRRAKMMEEGEKNEE